MNCKPILLIVIISIFCLNNTLGQWKNQSILSNGDIYKIEIPETGLYKLDYDYLSSLSEIDLGNINPQNIQIFGSKGGTIDQVINDNLMDDLIEIPIEVRDQDDGRFDNNDYILLYAEGGNKFDLSENDYSYIQNPYTSNNFIFLKVGTDIGLRISQVANVEQPEFTSDSKETAQHYELDRINLLGSFTGAQGSGQQWYGESFAGNNNQNFSTNFSFPNLIIGEEIEVESRFAARSDNATQYELSVNGNNYNTSINRTFTGDIESTYAYTKVINEKILIEENNLDIGITFFPTTSQDRGWLDYITVIAKEKCTHNNQPIFLSDRRSLDHSTFGFDISGANLRIWDVSQFDDIKVITPVTSGNNHSFGYEVNGELKSFVSFSDSDRFLDPGLATKISNQNIHDIQEADFVIVYYRDFKGAAEKLAAHRTQHDNFTTAIVDVEHIYNEFGGGKPDPSAIRNFAKMIWDRDKDFRYLLLMGDASYDYRGINEELPFQNYIPTYETLESLDPIEAFPSDDYFGLLEEGEGTDNLKGTMEIGIGRIPCKTNGEAQGVVDKIIHYDTQSATLGSWRMNLGFTADDEDGELHVIQADGIARATKRSHPELIQEKVYFDAFNQESTPGGARYPDARQQINRNIFDGQLVLNYLGHGGPKGWADERVLQITDILNWSNLDKLPVFITATCSFTGFDEPNFVSAGEHCLLNPNGGAISLFTTVRAVYANDNKKITTKVFENIFLREQGKAMRLGDIMRISQNEITLNDNRSLTNTRKFMLIGDPSLRLALPKHHVTIEKLNGTEITEDKVDTIGALQKVSLEGSIRDYQDDLLSVFNGNIELTVYDKVSRVKVLDNDNRNSDFTFDVQKNILYKGIASVTNGRFQMGFILPKDINFDFGQGYLSFYASDGISEDAGGYYDNLVIGGTSDNIITDNEGPDIDIYLDDRSFLSGDVVSKKPILIVDLSDENGINLSSTSIGHDITARVDDRNDNGIVLNEYFEATPDQVGAGTVTYQMEQLTEGLHTIYVKAWDILNNSSEEMTEFYIANDEEGFVDNVFNYPNPFVDNTNFVFEHDLGRTNASIEIEIYSMSGVLIKTIENQQLVQSSKVDNINWNGTDEVGNKLSKGIYLYKIKIESNELNVSRESDVQKLVILH